MIRRFCDCCEKEVNNLYSFKYLQHISGSNLCGYVDSEGNAVSGREVNLDLCISCYNKIVGTAYEEYRTKRLYVINEKENK